ncbi:MAG TPA: hypothetical protein VJB59_09950 [Bdellovibrionota bacterium]|nr:hypothetical protein [Bdellovibrionota bacterium]
MVSLTREELYNLVWSKPTTQLATEFGVSDVAIAKACRRYDIPKPPLGYWAKIRNGHMVRRNPLPAKKKEHSDQIVFQGQQQPEPPEPTPEIKIKMEQEALPENAIIIPDDLRSAHVLVRKTKDALQQLEPDEYGRVRPRIEGCLNIHVAKDSVRRALLIWQGLIKALDRRGHRIDVIQDRGQWSSGAWRTFVIIEQERVEVRMEEPTKRYNREPTEKEKKWGYWKKWGYNPTGKLNIIIEESSSYVGQRNWTDTDQMPIETRLNDFISALLLCAESMRIRALDNARRAKEEEARRKIWEEERKRAEREQARINDLETRLKSWEYSNNLRAFIKSIEERLATSGAIAIEPKLLHWLEWVKKHIDANDPVVRVMNADVPYLD